MGTAGPAHVDRAVPAGPFRDGHRHLQEPSLLLVSRQALICTPVSTAEMIFLKHKSDWVFFWKSLMAFCCLPNKLGIQAQQYVNPHLSTSLPFHSLKSSYSRKYKLLPVTKHFWRFLFTVPLLFVNFLLSLKRPLFLIMFPYFYSFL